MRHAPDFGEQTYRGSGRLEGRRAVITGRDSGIGRAVALAFAREGADVLISHLEEERDAQETLRVVRDAGAAGRRRLRARPAPRRPAGALIARRAAVRPSGRVGGLEHRLRAELGVVVRRDVAEAGEGAHVRPG
jgi:NAD(P)-dependent dehydrogenase (short-subunit alcohol dehydrogenase family)